MTDNLPDCLNGRVDLLFRIVDANRKPRARGDAEPLVERLRAVVSGAQADALASEDFREVVRVDAVDGEAEATTCGMANGKWQVANR